MVDKEQPERRMAVQALVPGALGAGLAFLAGLILGGSDSAVSALLGVCAVAGSFSLYVLALGKAREASPTAVQLVAMAGWMLRLGLIVAVLFGLDAAAAWFDPLAFGLAAIAGALAVAIWETRLWLAESRSWSGGAPRGAQRTHAAGRDRGGA